MPAAESRGSFAGRVAGAIASAGSLLCLGVDPDLTTCPDVASLDRHCVALVDGCLEHAAAVKANIAFFEQHGPQGLAVLLRLRERVPSDRLWIIDAKRGDIGSTADAYARALFDILGADAVTVNPLMGEDSVRPFLDRPGRGCFLLTRTSNPGAADFLELELADGTPLYRHIAALALRWDTGGNAGLVVGATAPEAIAALREAAPGMPFLVPGVGAQGGGAAAAVAAGLDRDGGGLLVNVGRAIAAAVLPAAAARAYARELNLARQSRAEQV